MEQYHTIIIGGGAAGLMAAITSARQGYKTLIIEKNKIIGRKILVTGNGRCNLTNIHIAPDLAESLGGIPTGRACKYYGENTKCLHNIFSRFSSKDTINFFENLGVRLKTEDEGRVFPITNQATTIVDLLTEELAHLKVSINYTEPVKELMSIKDSWEVRTGRNIYNSKNVILATGGKSYPQLGSTGDGFDIARRLGHRIIEPRPALVPLELEGNWFHKLQGVKSDVELTLTNGGKTIARETGEMLFTHYGISGPVVLNLSRLIIDYSNKSGSCKTLLHLQPVRKNTNGDKDISDKLKQGAGLSNGSDSVVFINFFPGYNADKLKQFIIDRWRTYPQKTLVNSLIGLLPKKLCSVLIGEIKLIGETKVNQITKNDLNSITENFTRWSILIKKARPFDESMITAGGVAMDDINTRTMESLKKKGLYLAGEILDIDGVSGGYNLQFAWSTGYLAGLQL